MSPTSALRIDGARLLRHLGELRAIGGHPDGGVTRLAFSASDVCARDLVGRWMEEAGLQVHTDAATNLIGRTRPAGRTLISGSHLDTVAAGGWLDGAYGVVAAIEVAHALKDAGVSLTHSYATVAFANEEGANGTVSFTGSSAFAGLPVDVTLPDDEGVTLAGRLRSAGGQPDALATAAWAPASIAGMVELHIEQGPVLEHTGLTIGVVESITARSTVSVVVTGKANHAGTTPMDLRRDAAVAAARMILATNELAASGLVRVATCGHLRLAPNVRNVVAGSAELGLDIRDADPDRIVTAVRALTSAADAVAAATDTTIEVSVASSVQGAPCHPTLVSCVQDAAESMALPLMRMPSGAGHDAQVIAEVAPVAMIFVPSIRGTSHHPSEDTRPEHLVAGADVLLHALLNADRRVEETTP